jgi:hypothetical protein
MYVHPRPIAKPLWLQRKTFDSEFLPILIGLTPAEILPSIGHVLIDQILIDRSSYNSDFALRHPDILLFVAANGPSTPRITPPNVGC